MSATSGDSRPLGIFDADLGGLSLADAVTRRMPAESTVLVADVVNSPYGGRHPAQVRSLVVEGLRYLEAEDVKLVILATPEACIAALDHAREVFDLPIVGVLGPAAQGAVERTRRGLIGVLWTGDGLVGEEYVRAVERIDPATRVYANRCTALWKAALLDSPNADRLQRLAGEATAEFRRMGADVVLLGTPGLSPLRAQLEAYLGDSVTVVDAAEEVAACVERRLRHAHLAADGAATRHSVVTMKPSGTGSEFLPGQAGLLRALAWLEGPAG